jgi:hypothetical protein
MKSIENYHDQIKGILHGFDRIIFKGRYCPEVMINVE